jgi:hypothetical protein
MLLLRTMKIMWCKYLAGSLVIFFVLIAGYFWMSTNFGIVTYSKEDKTIPAKEKVAPAEVVDKVVETPVWPGTIDTVDYDKRLLTLSHYKPPVLISVMSTSTNASGTVIKTYATSTPPSPLRYSSTTNVTIAGKHWPKSQVYPNAGAVLPFKRIVAYYGNFYSKYMGILGELAPDDMLAHLAKAEALWQAIDPTTPVLPAIEYIAMVAQAGAGADGMYRAIMPDTEIEKAYALTKKVNGVMILDIQVGLSPLTSELPKFKKYLERPDVFFALDPEFAMKHGNKPGTVIGSFDAVDINYAINYMSKIVRDNQLPPKVLLVHRFTYNMVTNAELIKPTPEVQVVMVMDGWGLKDLKRGTYGSVIIPEPVQFSGIKLFYKNDLKPPSTGLLTPQEVMDLNPKPIYVQYQ